MPEGLKYRCIGIVNDSLQVYDDLVKRLKKAYSQLESRIGDPLDSNTLIGPMHSPQAVMHYKAAIAEAIVQV